MHPHKESGYQLFRWKPTTLQELLSIGLGCKRHCRPFQTQSPRSWYSGETVIDNSKYNREWKRGAKSHGC